VASFLSVPFGFITSTIAPPANPSPGRNGETKEITDYKKLPPPLLDST
jgi:hypothetical protein